LLLYAPTKDVEHGVSVFIPINKIQLMRVYKLPEFYKDKPKYVFEVVVGYRTYSQWFDEKNSAMFFVKKINRILDEYKH
jgi:hypothetical protein